MEGYQGIMKTLLKAQFPHVSFGPHCNHDMIMEIRLAQDKGAWSVSLWEKTSVWRAAKTWEKTEDYFAHALTLYHQKVVEFTKGKTE